MSLVVIHVLVLQTVPLKFGQESENLNDSSYCVNGSNDNIKSKVRKSRRTLNNLTMYKVVYHSV